MRTYPRHRRPPALLSRLLFPLLAVITLAAGFVPGLLAASAAPVPAVLAAAHDQARPAAAIRAQLAIRQAATVQAARRAAAIAAAHTYTVRSGDSLSTVAARHCGQARMWTGIYAGSRARHWTAGNANVLAAGQHLWLSCAYLPSMLRFAPAPPPPPVPAARTVTRSYASSTGSRTYAAPAAAAGTYRAASGSYEACVISRESGGNAGAVNPSSGAGGLYQFLPSTWSSLGYSGLPQNASVSVQRQAFQKLYAQAGTSPWSPSDGCLRNLDRQNVLCWEA